MKKFNFFCLICIWSVNTQALEKELVPIMDAGVQVAWSYDTVIPSPGHSDPFKWQLGITPTIAPSSFYHMEWNIINLNSQTLLFSQWRTLPKDNPQSLKLIVSQDRILYDLLPRQESFKIIISNNRNDIEYFISLKKLCDKYPQQFLDLTNFSNNKCHAEASKLPDASMECSEHKRELQSWVDEGLLPCDEALEMYAGEKICGKFSCKNN